MTTRLTLLILRCGSVGCGPPCKTIVDAREALRFNRPSITRPHARVVLPHSLDDDG